MSIRSTSVSARAAEVRRQLMLFKPGQQLPVGDAVVSPSAQALVAAAYLALPDFDPNAVSAFAAFAEETMAQYALMRGLGIEHIVQDTDPYENAAQMIADVELQGTIRTLATATTGSHPYLSDEVNDAFRAVHDVLGHAATGRGFDRHGEEAAYQSHAAMYSPLARRALAVETRGQNAAMIARGGVFPAQKVALLPEWMTATDALDPSGPERYEATEQARAMHVAAGLRIRDESNVRALMESEGIARWEACLLDDEGIRPTR